MDTNLAPLNDALSNPTLQNLDFTPTHFLGSLYSVVYYMTILAALITFMIATLTYLSSSGDPGKIKKARTYLEAGVTSLVVIVFARFFFALLRNIQGGPGNVAPKTTSSELFAWIGQSMTDVLMLGLELGIVLVVVFIAWGGITYLFSAGDPGKIKKAISTITYALLGLVILILFFALSQFILDFTDYSNPDTATQVNELQINKSP